AVDRVRGGAGAYPRYLDGGAAPAHRSRFPATPVMLRGCPAAQCYRQAAARAAQPDRGRIRIGGGTRMSVIEKVFPLDHPASQGHFPGNPIIPGAVLLGETAHTIAADLAFTPALCQVRSAKFLHPVRP